MEINEKIALIEEIMDLDEGKLTLEANLDEFDEWDSLTKLSLMATAKKEFNKQLTVDELSKFKTVKDICDYLG